MKISDVVKALNRIKREFGDVEVMVSVESYNEETGEYEGHRMEPLEEAVYAEAGNALLITETEMEVVRLLEELREQYDGDEIIGHRG